jgi:LAO/AO transport system kinase
VSGSPGIPLIERVLARDRRALGRAISLIETGGVAGERLYCQVCALSRRAPVVGFTGPPGVGKSTLVAAYIGHLREQGKTVAVAAVDPSSPINGGALLGDRVRMVEHDGDEGVFIRSIGSRGHGGGVSAYLSRIAELLRAAGYDLVIVETVGAGQSDVELADLVDVKIVVGAPGLGDDVQAMKSGILEIADVLVMNKADMPRASQALGQLQAALKLREDQARDVAVIATTATSKKGIADLATAIDARIAARPIGSEEKDLAHARRLLSQLVARLATEHITSGADQRCEQICAQIASGRRTLSDGATAVLGVLFGSR